MPPPVPGHPDEPTAPVVPDTSDPTDADAKDEGGVAGPHPSPSSIPATADADSILDRASDGDIGMADSYHDEAKDFETPDAPGDDRGAFEVDVDRAREAAGLSGDFGQSMFAEADMSAPYVDDAKGDISPEPHRVGLDRIAHQVGLALQDDHAHEAATTLSKSLDLPFLLGWAAHDALTGTPGRLSAWREGEGISAHRRFREVAPDLFDFGLAKHALKAHWGRVELMTPEEYRKVAPIGPTLNLADLYPGAPWIEAGHDRRLTADDIPNLAFGAVEFAPWGKVFSGARTAYKGVAPSKLGGAFLSATTPDTHVPRLFGPQSSQELVDAANRAAYELATTGSAKVTVGGRTQVIDQARLDEAYRLANPGKTLTTTAATDVRAFEAGGAIPEFTFPSGAPKPPIEQFQYRTGGASGVVRLAHRSAYGHLPPPAGAPGLAIYSDPISELYIPGMRPTPLEEAIQPGRIRPGDRTYYGGGREVELGKLTGQETQPLRPVAGVGETRAVTTEGTMAPVRVFQAEDLVSPTYGERVRANVLGKLDEIRGRHTSGPSLRQATAEEIARGRFGKKLDDPTTPGGRGPDGPRDGLDDPTTPGGRGPDGPRDGLDDPTTPGGRGPDGPRDGLDDPTTPGGRGPDGPRDGLTSEEADYVARGLTPGEAHYVALAQKGDDVLGSAAARGDETAQQILTARTELAETLQRGAQEAAERRVFAGRTYGRDTSGLYVPRGDTPEALDPFDLEAILDRRDGETARQDAQREAPPTTTTPPTTRTTPTTTRAPEALDPLGLDRDGPPARTPRTTPPPPTTRTPPPPPTTRTPPPPPTTRTPPPPPTTRTPPPPPTTRTPPPPPTTRTPPPPPTTRTPPPPPTTRTPPPPPTTRTPPPPPTTRTPPPPPTTRTPPPPPTTRTPPPPPPPTTRTPPPPTVRTPRLSIPPTTRRPPPGTPATARRPPSPPPSRRRPTPTPTPDRPPRLHPRTVEWSQGWARHRLDLLTGEHSVRRAPARELRVTEYTPRIVRPRRINLGLVDTVIAPDGTRQFLDQDAQVLPSGEIVRRRADRQRPPRRRGVL